MVSSFASAAPGVASAALLSSSGDDSLNTELLDAQNSAENLRHSMHRFMKGPNPPPQATATRNSQQFQQPQQQPRLSLAPSLGNEDESQQQQQQHMFQQPHALGRLRTPVVAPSMDSDSMMVVGAAASTNPPPHRASGRSVASSSSSVGAPVTNVSHILRPCDQYPSEQPGVLLRSGQGQSGATVGGGGVRPVSALSLRSLVSAVSASSEHEHSEVGTKTPNRCRLHAHLCLFPYVYYDFTACQTENEDSSSPFPLAASAHKMISFMETKLLSTGFYCAALFLSPRKCMDGEQR